MTANNTTARRAGSSAGLMALPDRNEAVVLDFMRRAGRCAKITPVAIGTRIKMCEGA